MYYPMTTICPPPPADRGSRWWRWWWWGGGGRGGGRLSLPAELSFPAELTVRCVVVTLPDQDTWEASSHICPQPHTWGHSQVGEPIQTDTQENQSSPPPLHLPSFFPWLFSYRVMASVFHASVIQKIPFGIGCFWLPIVCCPTCPYPLVGQIVAGWGMGVEVRVQMRSGDLLLPLLHPCVLSSVACHIMRGHMSVFGRAIKSSDTPDRVKHRWRQEFKPAGVVSGAWPGGLTVIHPSPAISKRVRQRFHLLWWGQPQLSTG